MWSDALFPEHVDHVGEVFVMSALVGRHGDSVGILLNGGAHDVRHAAVMAQVHYLGAMRLEQAPDHVDGGVMPVEQRRGTDEAQRMRLAAGRPGIGTERQHSGGIHVRRLETQGNGVGVRSLSANAPARAPGPNLPASIFRPPQPVNRPAPAAGHAMIGSDATPDQD